tara:strand:- start:6546 stop:6713 length:168 start_codon:yes stop_codon:yes gene_type:complete
MPAKVKKSVKVVPVKNHDAIQIDIKKSLDDDKKIKPEKIFDSYKKKEIKKIKKKY